MAKQCAVSMYETASQYLFNWAACSDVVSKPDALHCAGVRGDIVLQPVLGR